MNDTGSAFVLFVFGIVIGATVMCFASMNELGVSKMTYENCQTACATNLEVKRCYVDGDCLCVNGAFFDAEDIRHKERK